MNINEFFFNCLLHSNWQMNDSERFSLLGLLLYIKPKLVLELGTYKGGATSLFSKYSDNVITVDIDSNCNFITEGLSNVTQIISSSNDFLPKFVNEINSETQECPDLILIDALHTKLGVQSDINHLLSITIFKSPTIILIHDSGNAECRSGILSANWFNNSFLKYFDVDFVPGRIVEHGGAGHGEVWGGLAIAIFDNNMSELNSTFAKSANLMIEYLDNYVKN